MDRSKKATRQAVFILAAMAAPLPLCGQSLATVTVGEFMDLEAGHRSAVAGMYIGAMVATPAFVSEAAGCMAEWQARQPDTYIATLTDTWLDMIEIGLLGARLSDPGAEADSRAQLVALLFEGFLLMSCGGQSRT